MRKISPRLKSDDDDKTKHNNTPSQRPHQPSPSPTSASLNWRYGNVSPRWCCCGGEKRQRGQRQRHVEKQKQKQQSTIKHARFFLANALSLHCSSCQPKTRYVKSTHRRGNSLFIIATISQGRITHHNILLRTDITTEAVLYQHMQNIVHLQNHYAYTLKIAYRLWLKSIVIVHVECKLICHIKICCAFEIVFAILMK